MIWGRRKVVFSEKTSCLVHHKCIISGLNKSANQQPSQNRFLCVQKSNYNHCLSFQKEFSWNRLYSFWKAKNNRSPLALLKSSWKCYFNARECLMGFSGGTSMRLNPSELNETQDQILIGIFLNVVIVYNVVMSIWPLANSVLTH